MEIKIGAEALAKKKLMVATPMYGGVCAGLYTRSLVDLAALCGKWNVQLQLYFQLFDVPRILAYALAFVAVVQLVEWTILQPLEQRIGAWRR